MLFSFAFFLLSFNTLFIGIQAWCVMIGSFFMAVME